MKINISKEQLKVLGTIGLKIGKQIVIDGSTAIVLKGAKVAVETVFGGKGRSLSTITLDDVLSGKRSIERDLLFTEEGAINTKTGELYRKITPFEQDVRDGLKGDGIIT